MKSESLLLPKVFPNDSLGLGYLTVNPAYPNFQPFPPPRSVADALRALEAESEPTPNPGLYWGIAKRGWFSLQLWRLAGIETGVAARSALVVRGGTTHRQAFNDVTAAFEAVLAARETQAWIRKISAKVDRVYFVAATVRIAGAEVTHALHKSAGAGASVTVPLDQLSPLLERVGIVGGFCSADFGISSVKDVNGIFAAAYHEVRIRSGNRGGPPDLDPTVTWVRPPTALMGRPGDMFSLEASLGDSVGLDTLAEMADAKLETMKQMPDAEMEGDEEDNEQVQDWGVPGECPVPPRTSALPKLGIPMANKRQNWSALITSDHHSNHLD